jgi:putative transposase
MTTLGHPTEWIAFDPFDRITINGIAYTCVQSDQHGHQLRRVETPHLIEFFPHAQMAVIERSLGYRYDREWFKEGKVKSRQISGVTMLADIPKKEQARILWKWEYCTRFQRMCQSGEVKRTNEAMTAAIEQISAVVNMLDCAKINLARNARRKGGKPAPVNKDGRPRKSRAGTEKTTRDMPTYRTLQRWLATLEACDWAIESLRDGYRHSGNRRERLDAEMAELTVSWARKFAAQRRPTRELLYTEFEGAVAKFNESRLADGLPQLPCPSQRHFYAEIRSLDQFWVYARRHTLDAAKRKFAAEEDGPEATRIGERIEMDEWNVGLQTLLIRARVWQQLDRETREQVKRIRVWLYVAIDCATRCVLAMRMAEAPSAAEAIATLRMIVSDKTKLAKGAKSNSQWFMSTGIGRLVVDFGSAFVADETRSVVAGMGATFENPPKKLPQLRGKVERIFSTTETRLMPFFSGRTFSNVVQRGDYNSEKGASIPVDVLARVLVRHVVDDYHNRPHGGLGGETPANAWRRIAALTGRIHVPDPHLQRHIFGVEDTCTLDGGGVNFLGLRYQNKTLYDWFTHRGKTEVRVRVDPDDVGYASVKLDADWITVPCRKPELQGQPLRVWKDTALNLRAQFRDEAALSRPIVLEAVRDIGAIAREYQAEAGISEELDTPEALQRARDALGFGFELPEWDAPEVGDLLDGIIPVERAPPHISSAIEQQPMPLSEVPASEAGWRMGDMKEDS